MLTTGSIAGAWYQPNIANVTTKEGASFDAIYSWIYRNRYYEEFKK
jgi:hypothetical protein